MLTDGMVSFDYSENVDLLQRGVFHFLQLQFSHLLSSYLNNFHSQLRPGLLAETPVHHTAYTPEDIVILL